MCELKNHRVMVAGGAGFVGSSIIRELLKREISVICYDNYLHGVPENVQNLDGPLTVIHGDVLDEWKLVHTLQKYKVDYIINCVGDTFVPTAYEMPKRFFDINLMGNFNILQAARVCGIKRTLYVSSTEVYGRLPVPKATEETPLNPVNTYSVSKLAADRICFTFYIEHKLPVVIARIFNCYGPRETHPYIIPEIIYQLHKSNILHLGNLEAERDFTYVYDTACALIAVLESDIPNGDTVNVGSDCCYSVRWLANTLAEIMGVKGMDICQDPDRLRRYDIDKFHCDNSKLKKFTNWSPQVEIIEGLKATVEWFYSNGCQWSWESFVDGTKIYR